VVFKNDEKTVDEIASMNPKGVMVSPGPGRPEDSGISLEAVEKLGPEFGVFGVCMGHQCIGQVFGGNIVRAPCGLMHGKSSPVWHTEDASTMLHGLTSPFQAARYHSLVIDRDGFPEDELEVTAWTEDETIMAVKHRRYPKIQGVQFHPESIITENGLTIIRNWVALINA
jgi:anthranilate synthase component 2